MGGEVPHLSGCQFLSYKTGLIALVSVRVKQGDICEVSRLLRSWCLSGRMPKELPDCVVTWLRTGSGRWRDGARMPWGHGALLMSLSHGPPPPPPLLAASSRDLEIVGCPGAAPGSFLSCVTLFVNDFMLPRH